MGIFIGLDFGTTTSILSYLDGGEPKPFSYGGHADGTPYVSSVVAYMPRDLHIGHHAIQRLSEGASIYRYFKMLLTEEARENWSADYGPYATESLTPAEVAADFIGEMINGSSPGRERLSPKRPNRHAFRQAHGKEIEGLVVSVPQVWSHWRAYGRQQLQTVVRELGLPLMQLISEPVAAAAYFAYLYSKKQGTPYSGNLLICDMGGGTFDVTLCKLREGRVEVLHNAGNGEHGLGIAGARFDRNLLDLKQGVGPGARDELLVNLDQQKKSGANTDRLLRYLEVGREERVKPIYTVASTQSRALSFSYDEVLEAFAAVREGIFDVLTRVSEEAGRLGQPIDKVVLVGGFSKFPLVQKAVGEFFGENVFASPRLVDLDTLNSDDMAFAISYGACLIANGKVEVTEKYDHTISIFVYNSAGLRNDEEELELIRSGKSLGSLSETTFCCREDGQRRPFRVTGDSVRARILIRLSGGSSPGDRIVRELSLKDIPNSQVKDNRWYLGTRVDYSKIPYLVVKDARHGVEKEYPLGDLIPPIIMEHEESELAEGA